MIKFVEISRFFVVFCIRGVTLLVMVQRDSCTWIGRQYDNQIIL